MRQEGKQAAAEARELLRSEAQRKRTTKSSQSWKASSSSTTAAQKQKATGGDATTPEQMSSGRAVHLPEQNGASAYGAGTPMSFIDGGYFFNGTGSFFSGSPMSQPWMLPSDPATWEKIQHLLADSQTL